MSVKNSDTLPHNEAFEEIEKLMSGGREIVLRAIEATKRPDYKAR
jgi:hypothetical protein